MHFFIKNRPKIILKTSQCHKTIQEIPWCIWRAPYLLENPSYNIGRNLCKSRDINHSQKRKHKHIYLDTCKSPLFSFAIPQHHLPLPFRHTHTHTHKQIEKLSILCWFFPETWRFFEGFEILRTGNYIILNFIPSNTQNWVVFKFIFYLFIYYYYVLTSPNTFNW
jgi:hypothetical protein